MDMRRVLPLGRLSRCLRLLSLLTLSTWFASGGSSADAQSLMISPEEVEPGDTVVFSMPGATDFFIQGPDNLVPGVPPFPAVIFSFPITTPDSVTQTVLGGAVLYQFDTAQLSTTTKPVTYNSVLECLDEASFHGGGYFGSPPTFVPGSGTLHFKNGCHTIAGHVFAADGHGAPDTLLLITALEFQGGNAGLLGDGYIDTGFFLGYIVVKTGTDGAYSAVVPAILTNGNYFGTPPRPFVGYRVMLLGKFPGPISDGVEDPGQVFPLDYKVDQNDPTQLVNRDFYVLPRIVGTVRDAKGRGVEQVQVLVEKSPEGTIVTGATTDTDGKYAVSVPKGSYLVMPSAFDPQLFSPPNRFLDIDIGNGDRIADFEFNGFRLSGYVRDDSQTGVSSVEIQASQGGNVVGDTFTDGEGHYEMPLKHGTYDVSALDPDPTDDIPVRPPSRTVNMENDDGFADFQLGNNEPPVADFTSTVSDSDELTYSFDASPSTDDQEIDAYRWLINGELRDGKMVDYTFPSDGTYGVGLVVTDNQGATGEKSIQLNVGAQLTADLSFSTTTPKRGAPFDVVLTVKNGSDKYTVTAVQVSDLAYLPINDVDVVSTSLDQFDLGPGEQGTFRVTFKINSLDPHSFTGNVIGFLNGKPKSAPQVSGMVTPVAFDPSFKAHGPRGDNSAPDPTINNVNEVLKHVRVTDHVTFEGSDWDPNGGPIVVTVVNGVQVGSFPPQPDGSFTGGALDVGQFPRSSARDLGRLVVCGVPLQATQGGVMRRVELLGRPVEEVAYAENVVDSQGTPYRPFDFLCEGEFAYPGNPQAKPIVGGENTVDRLTYDEAADPTYICNIATEPLRYLTIPFDSVFGEGGRRDAFTPEPQFYGGFWYQERTADGICSDFRGILAQYILLNGHLIAVGKAMNSSSVVTLRRSVLRPIEQIGPNSVIAQTVNIVSEPPADDLDHDNIKNAVDGKLQNGAFIDQSNEFSQEFALAGTSTSGAIVDRGAQSIAVDQAAGGAWIAVSSEQAASLDNDKATVQICGFFTKVDSGDSANFQCGSLILEVLSGPIEIELGADVEVQAPGGVTATVRQLDVDHYSVEHTAGLNIPIVIILAGAMEESLGPGESTTVVSRPDADGDGVADADDLCPDDFYKSAPGICGCGTKDVDSDGDGTIDCQDGCPFDFAQVAPGICGCGKIDSVDTDGDGTPDCIDACPDDPAKITPGVCGCGVSDRDSDGDGTPDCTDLCPTDPNKVAPGQCGCGSADRDTDGDGTPDCKDLCPTDPNKVAPGLCGCGVADRDSDGDGTPDCNDQCPADRNKVTLGVCGCGTTDTDSDKDGIADCVDNCPSVPNPDQADANHNGVGDACEQPARHEKTICQRLSRPLDIDRFSFTGALGENVTVVLRADSPSSRGDHALLLLVDRIRGVTLRRSDGSSLPDEVEAKLPKAGAYEVLVASVGPGSLAFKGSYCVTLQSSAKAFSTFLRE